MNTRTLMTLFLQGTNWNAFFYFIYKVSYTALSFLLFARLTTQDFSLWANLNSIIFLTLLWLDFGLRKSIPRYSPIFAQNHQANNHFIRNVLLFQGVVLIIATPLFLYSLKKVTVQLGIAASLAYLGTAIFFIEGMVNVLRLMYHAHFLNKQFNLLTTGALLAEMAMNGIVLWVSQESSHIIMGIIASKIFSGVVIASVGLIRLPSLYKDSTIQPSHTINERQTEKAFIKHSALMWINNMIKSLSERNFLMPLFTYTLGAPLANIFKVANDGALFFYRIVLKTIGTTDTALLAHIEVSGESKKLLPFAFKKLARRIAGLCIPLVGILILICLSSTQFFDKPIVFQSFLIMVIGYLSEMLVSPYERVLEIKQRYLLLTIAYAPYLLIMFGLLTMNFITSIGLIPSILLIQGVRLVSSFSMVYLAHTHYKLSFPIRFFITYTSLCGLVSLGIYYVLWYMVR